MRKRKRRITPPKERYLIALFHKNEANGKVYFKGFALSPAHASEMMLGDGGYAASISQQIRGETTRMVRAMGWYAIKIPFKWDQLITATDMAKMAAKAQRLAEIKLKIRDVIMIQDDVLMNDDERTDALLDALKKTQPEIGSVLDDDQPVNEWKTEVEEP